MASPLPGGEGVGPVDPRGGGGSSLLSAKSAEKNFTLGIDPHKVGPARGVPPGAGRFPLGGWGTHSLKKVLSQLEALIRSEEYFSRRDKLFLKQLRLI